MSLSIKKDLSIKKALSRRLKVKQEKIIYTHTSHDGECCYKVNKLEYVVMERKTYKEYYEDEDKQMGVKPKFTMQYNGIKYVVFEC